MPRSLQCMRMCRAIQYFPKGASCPWGNAYNFHSMWHRSCTRAGYQDMASSMRQGPSEGRQCQNGMKSRYGCTDYLVVGHRIGWIYHYSTEQLIVYVTVKMFYQLSVRESGVSLQHHKGNLCRRAEKQFLRPSRCSERPTSFATLSNGNTE